MTYKRFFSFRTSVSVALLAVFLIVCIPQLARASDSNLYTVKGVKVDITDENAYAAREKAFQQGLRNAFSILIGRLAAHDSQQNFISPSQDVLDSLVLDYEVTSEKLSAVRYIGTYTFRFKESAVKTFFSGNAVSYSDMESDPVLILPFYDVNGRYELWSYNNRWKEAWDRMDTQSSLVPFVVPVGDLADVSAVDAQRGLDYEREKLFGMLDRYDASEVIIAVAEPDSALLEELSNQVLSGQGSLIVNLYNTQGDQAQYVTRIFVSAQEGQTADQLFDRAVYQAQALLRENWKSQTSVRADQQNMIEVQVDVRSLKDWQNIQRTLGKVGVINELQVVSMSPKEISFLLSYTGNIERLQFALRRMAFKLQPASSTEAKTNLGTYALVR